MNVMNRQGTTILMHVPAPATDADIDALASHIHRLRGVSRVERGAKVRRVMLIDYDPVVVSANAFVSTADARGLPARLVGM
jgi:sensor domain CHASE-containing protein